MKKFVLAIDQGTTGSTVLIIDQNLEVKAKVNVEFPQIYPKSGWVEHNPEDIWNSVEKAIAGALSDSGVKGEEIAAIGITNQRETCLLWERETGQPIHNAIVWQCRRTAEICEELKNAGYSELYHQKTGLVLDPYFSGTKVRWLLENYPDRREQAERGELAFGTIDTYLVWRLTGGQAFVTDVSNASRTLMMDIHTLEWSDELLKPLGVPKAILPEIRGNSEVYGYTKGLEILPDGIPISGMAGDQQAALFGQACFGEGEAKCTYGTGAFILVNTGEKPVFSKNGILTTVAWKLGEKTTYALEGSVFIAGAAVQWLRDQLGIISTSAEVEELARSVPDSGGVIFVPALAGLGAPRWRPEARGLLWGLTRATDKGHIARATLEGIAFMIYEVLEAMADDLGKPLRQLKVDGGASVNSLMMQFQSDLLQTEIVRPKMIETTAFGAAFLAGLSTCVWKSTDEIAQVWLEDRRFSPQIDSKERDNLTKKWKKFADLA